MTKFFKRKKKIDPYTEAIGRVFNKVDKIITPSEVAHYLGIHPNTAKKKILKLKAGGYVDCKKEGKKLFCKRRKFINF